MKLDSKGITIVELMIGIVMFSMITLGVTFFISTGTKTCHEAEDTINVQEESQIVLNQLVNITLEGNSIPAPKTAANGDVCYFVMNTDKNTNITDKEKILYFQKSSGNLYYYEVDASTTSAVLDEIKKEITGSKTVIHQGELMGEHIADFQVNLDTDLYRVTFKMKFNLSDKEILSKNSVILRNKYVETKDAFITV